ncbi:MAG TPA: hypothetical protein VFS63_11575 [Pseudolabrys sp.]|jgi:hypothetical protein|nr:hypothetical protein [Pseudolabrys sp.]HZZ76981.1 hypothetical protein [Gemmataceae bacterium]
MKAFITACVVAAVIAVIGSVVLGGFQKTVDQAFVTSSVRLSG